MPIEVLDLFGPLGDAIKALVDERVAEEVERRLAEIKPANEESTIDDKAAARMLGLSPATLKTMRRRGEGPTYYRVARRAVRYQRSDVEAYKARRSRNRGPSKG